MLAPLLLALLSAAPEVEESLESRGQRGTVPTRQFAARQLPRARLGVAGIVAMAGQIDRSLTGGAGVAAEIGGIFGDRVSVYWHGEIATTISSLYGSNAVQFDVAIGEHLAIGAGVAFALWQQFFDFGFESKYGGYGYGLGFAGFTFPVRATMSFTGRKDGVITRSGWFVTLQVAPGVSLYPTYYDYSFAPTNTPNSFGISASLGVGVLTW